MAYTTLADVREYLGLEASQTDDDTLLQAFIDQGTAYIEEYCRRKFEAFIDTRFYNPVEDVVDGMLILDEDLLTVTVLSINDTIIASSNYKLLPRNNDVKSGITLLNSSGITWSYSTDPEDSVYVTGEWGRSSVPPDDLIYTLWRIVAYWYRKKDAQVFEDTAFAQAGTITVPKGMPQDIIQHLATYRRRTIRS